MPHALQRTRMNRKPVLFFHLQAKAIEFIEIKRRYWRSQTDRRDFSRNVFFFFVKKKSTALATVHFINTLSLSCEICMVLCSRLWKPRQKPEKQSQDVRISTDIHWAGSAAAKKTRGLHRWEASIQQHKVIVSKSIVARWSAYWQSPQLDSNSTEVRALSPSLSLSLFPSLSQPIAWSDC